MKSQSQLLGVWYVVLGIECGSGFVARGWGWNGSNVKRRVPGVRRQCGSPRCHRSISNPAEILILQSRSVLHRARNKDIEDDNVKDSSRAKSENNIFTSLFSDIWNRRRDEPDGTDSMYADGEDKKKSDKQRENIKKQSNRGREDSAASSNSNSWFRRFFNDGRKADQSPMGNVSSVRSKTLRRTTKQRAQSSPPETQSTPSYAFSRKAAADKRKKLEEKNKSPPSFNPLLYVQTAWKNTAAALFDNSDKKDEWFTVFQTSGIMPGESVPITVRGLDLLVVASLDGRSLYCIANSCPHLGTPLETGQLTRLPMEEPSSSETGAGATFVGADVFASSQDTPSSKDGLILSETQVSEILSQDGCEDCIVCPLHRTAFALRSGAVRGDWCPYPPVLGPALGIIKTPRAVTTYDIRTRGKNVQVKLRPANSSPNLIESSSSSQ